MAPAPMANTLAPPPKPALSAAAPVEARHRLCRPSRGANGEHATRSPTRQGQREGLEDGVERITKGVNDGAPPAAPAWRTGQSAQWRGQ